MAAELIDLLARSTLVSSAAILALLLLRAPLGRLAGYRVVYASWWLVPIALLALALPGRTVQIEAPQLPVIEAFDLVAMDSSSVTASAVLAGVDASSILLIVWLIGFALAVSVFLRQQRRFRRRVGRLSARPDGNFTSATRLHGPVVIGLLRPRIIVPLDFEQRYKADERALILAHEAVHLRRGDLLANFAMTILRCLYWFNPLLQVAALRFSQDQELACDATVVARFPESRRRYADAMLKTQLADLGLPVGCAWQSSHPMRERIAMLKNPLPSALRSTLGAAAVVALSFGCIAVVWAAQPPDVVRIEARTDAGAAGQPEVVAAESSQLASEAIKDSQESPTPSSMPRAANRLGNAPKPGWWMQLPGAAPNQAGYMNEGEPVDC